MRQSRWESREPIGDGGISAVRGITPSIRANSAATLGVHVYAPDDRTLFAGGGSDCNLAGYAVLAVRVDMQDRHGPLFAGHLDLRRAVRLKSARGEVADSTGGLCFFGRPTFENACLPGYQIPESVQRVTSEKSLSFCALALDTWRCDDRHSICFQKAATTGE
jgi:hypothetical protein